jgi:hypothetical protein
VNRPGTESFQAIEGKEVARWVVQGKAVLQVDAPMAAAGDGLRFFRFRIVDGPALGVLTLPVAPADLPKGKIVSCDGINGSGGRQRKVCFEQDAPTFKLGGVIEMRFTLPAGGGTVTFKKSKGIDIPAEALISEALCATLPIEADADKIVIDASKPLKAATVHVVTLRFNAAKVDAPTMMVIDGWVSLASGGGHHAIRGVIVQP